ncbi:MAG: cation-transporting P-type ATPase [Actinobacteria bacterium]|nr:cation-transporting P-type ATPase [Actinomycetota bacterium]
MIQQQAPYRRTPADVADDLGVDPERGLDADEVRRRRERHGENRLREGERRRWTDVLLEQFRSTIVLLLLVAAGISLAFGQLPEALAIGAALVVDAIVGFVTELRALRSMDSLRALEQTTARVRRGGREEEVPASGLVPGDVVLLREGDVVPADLRLVLVEDLQVDESALTGESMPVPKTIEASEGEVPLAERTSAAYKGTAVTRGRAVGITVATAMETEIGHISELVEQAEKEITPLERRLDHLGRRLIVLTLAMAALVAVAGLVSGRDAFTIIETAIVLGVAAVPEGLPIVASLALARGVQRMARRNALVKRLSAVETLGSAGVIMTDKTGTLTEGRMRVSRLASLGADARDLSEAGTDAGRRIDEGPVLRTLLETAVLCTDADAGAGTGDPMELAILDLGEQVGASRHALVEGRPQLAARPFERDSKMMATFHGGDGGVLVAVKGAPEAVLDACTAQAADDGATALDDRAREDWRARNRELAGDGLRVLAVARADRAEVDREDPYHDLTLLGLVGLFDPPRAAATEAVAECHRAGIRVIMVTGDQPATARAIAHAVGVTSDPDAEVMTGHDVDDPDEAPEEDQQRYLAVDVFARVSPEDKLDLIALHQNAGAVVGMTGDGVNDAPALQKADIGIAMGERGTEVAQDAADIVLLDDAFDTIVEAIRYGRTVFTNIRKFIVYLLSGNLAEILAVTAATVAGLPLPLLPLQILYINFVADIFPALALGLGPATGDVMADPPRDPDEPVLDRARWYEVGAWGVLIALTVMGSLLFALFVLDLPAEEVAGVSFLTFGFARIWHVFNMRRPGSTLFVNEVTTNRYVWLAFAIGVGLMLLAAYLGPLASLLEVAHLGRREWGTILVGSLAPLVIGQLVRSSTGGRAGGAGSVSRCR